MQAKPAERHKTNAQLTTDKFKNRTHLCAQLSHTTQHGAVLIIFPLDIQKIAKIHPCDSDVDENRAGCSHVTHVQGCSGAGTRWNTPPARLHAVRGGASSPVAGT